MKKLIVNYIIILLAGQSACQLVEAQGTMTYLSNLDQASAGSLAVGNNSWLAEIFRTGINTGGYVLDSVQLGMAYATGSPSNFTAMIYSSQIAALGPRFSLGTLNGSLNPASSGIYTFTTISNIMLSPSTYYYVVLTAGTTIANGTYEWSYSGTNSYNGTSGWTSLGNVLNSSDGSSWSSTFEAAQFAINASAVPEPGILSLFALGGLGFLWHRRRLR